MLETCAARLRGPARTRRHRIGSPVTPGGSTAISTVGTGAARVASTELDGLPPRVSRLDQGVVTGILGQQLRRPSRDYVLLHRAYCHTITVLDPDGDPLRLRRDQLRGGAQHRAQNAHGPARLLEVV